MFQFVPPDNKFLLLPRSPPDEEFGAQGGLSLTCTKISVGFVSVFWNSSHVSMICIPMPFILSMQAFSRGLPGGWERVQLGLSLGTPSQPPVNPQATLSQPPLYSEQVENKTRRFSDANDTDPLAPGERVDK